MYLFRVSSIVLVFLTSLSLLTISPISNAKPQDYDESERFDERYERSDEDEEALEERLPERKPAPLVIPREGSMTPRRLAKIVKKLGPIIQKRGNVVVFEVEDRLVTLAVDVRANRMRLMTPIVKTDQLSKSHLMRLLQANFDTSLDARYAVAKGILWSTYIHPLSSLHKNQFILAVGQTINAARTFGTTFSSGVLSFGGGDSRNLIEREILDELLKKGDRI